MKKSLGIFTEGGQGSGNFGHSGRPGEIGGSSSSGEGQTKKSGSRTGWKVLQRKVAINKSTADGEWDVRALKKGDRIKIKKVTSAGRGKIKVDLMTSRAGGDYSMFVKDKVFKKKYFDKYFKSEQKDVSIARRAI